jgi:hypothetical protein
VGNFLSPHLVVCLCCGDGVLLELSTCNSRNDKLILFSQISSGDNSRRRDREKENDGCKRQTSSRAFLVPPTSIPRQISTPTQKMRRLTIKPLGFFFFPFLPSSTERRFLLILARCAENYYCRQILWFRAVADLEAIVRQKRRRRS